MHTVYVEIGFTDTSYQLEYYPERMIIMNNEKVNSKFTSLIELIQGRSTNLAVFNLLN